MTFVLGVDPGETTGLAWMDSAALMSPIDERWSSLVQYGTIDGGIGQQIWKIAQGCRRLRVRVVAVETADHFLLRNRGPGTLKKSSLVPIKLAGGLMSMTYALSMQFGDAGVTLVEQTAGQAKGAVTNQHLEAYGFRWKKTGVDRHAMDGVRQLVLLSRRYRESKRVDSEFWRALRLQEDVG